MTENFRGRKGIIIGGGASGLMAAITAAEQGAAVSSNRAHGPSGKEDPVHRKRKMQPDEPLYGSVLLPER